MKSIQKVFSYLERNQNKSHHIFVLMNFFVFTFIFQLALSLPNLTLLESIEDPYDSVDVPSDAMKIIPFSMEKTGEWTFDSTNTNGMYTTTDGSSLSFKFHGTAFYVYAFTQSTYSILRIIVDDNTSVYINTYNQTDNMQPSQIYHLDGLENIPHTVKLVNIVLDSSKNKQEVSYVRCVGYLVLPESDVVSKSIEDAQTRITGDWTTLDNEMWTGQQYATMDISYPGTQFWLNGTFDPGHYVFEISAGDITFQVSQNLPERLENSCMVVLPPEYAFYHSDHLVYIRYVSEGGAMSFNNFSYYNPTILEPDSSDTVDSSAIRILTSSMEQIGDWSLDTEHMRGVYTTEHRAYLSFSFKGTALWLFSNLNNDQGIVILEIDDKEVAYINTYGSSLEEYKQVYSIKNLEDSTHTVKIINCHNNDRTYIRPCFVRVLGSVVTPSDAVEVWANDDSFTKTGSWKTVDNQGTYSESDGSTMTFSYYGGQFWLYGTFRPEHGSMRITVDTETWEINEYLYSEDELTNCFLFSLAQMSIDNHTIKIVHLTTSQTDRIGPIEISRIRYVSSITPSSGDPDQQAIRVLSFAMEKTGSWVLDSSNEDYGFWTYDNGSSLSFKFTGTGFWVYGTTNNKCGAIIIDVDGDFQTINTFSSSNSANRLLYSKSGLSDNEHTLTITNLEYNGGSFAQIANVYIKGNFSIPSQKIVNISCNELAKEWLDGDGGKYTLTDQDSITYSYMGTQFWIYGTLDSTQGSAEITFDGQRLLTFDTRGKGERMLGNIYSQFHPILRCMIRIR